MRDSVIVGLTLLVAMMLLILPLPGWAIWCRPAWVFMMLMFWMLNVPSQVGIGVAFFVGLILDLLTGTVLGQHAFVLSILAYFMLTFRVRIRHFPFWKQTAAIMVLTVAYMALQYWVMALMGASPDTWKYWLPILTTTLLWPWVCLLLRDFQHRFEG